jgi:ribosome-associated protein
MTSSEQTDTAITPDDIPTITLTNVLKLSGFAETGGDAKHLIQGGQVKVNGAVETRRKRKLVEGDEIEVDGESFVLELEDDPEDPPVSEANN